MKLLLTLAFVGAAFLFGGCADQSLMTDEEYARTRGPAPHSPDAARYTPQTSPYTSGRY